VEKTVNEVVVLNKSDYSEKFIKDLEEDSGLGKKFVLKDSLLIINDHDTAYFSPTPKRGQVFILKGNNERLAITLTVKRINYTSIDYNIEMVQKGKKNYTQNGQADIISSFFLGTESDEDDSGLSYFVTEFHGSLDKACFPSIRLGYSQEGPRLLLGKLIKNCNDEITDISLDNFPTLKEK